MKANIFCKIQLALRPKLIYICAVNQVLIAARISELCRQQLIDRNLVLIDYDVLDFGKINKSTIQGIITSNKLVLNQAEIEKYPSLQWIGRLGSGMEIIDTAYCDQKGIRYFSSPNGIANSVAEHCVGMLLCLQHHISISFEQIKNQQWIRELNRGFELENKTIGIIGYGHTGMAFAKKLSVFTKNIIAYDAYKSDFSTNEVQEVSLQQLRQQADIISFHVPLNEETKYYYNTNFMHMMQKNHIVMNASRGAVVDTSVLLQGLVNGKIVGACLDVLEEEKNIYTILQENENIIAELLKYNVLITPHIAGYSFNAIDKMCAELMGKLFD